MNMNSGDIDDNQNNDKCIVREQDRFMPIANVIRIMRKILPPHAKISDDAKETIQECVSEYISFITGEANDRCQKEQRKTITAEDVLWAMSKLGFDDYIEPLTLYLHRYREFDGGDRGGTSQLRGDMPHPFMVKRHAVDVPCGGVVYPGTSAFHLPPHNHHHGHYGSMSINGGGFHHIKKDVTNGGGFHHIKKDVTNGGGSTSKAGNGSHDRFTPTPKDE